MSTAYAASPARATDEATQAATRSAAWASGALLPVAAVTAAFAFYWSFTHQAALGFVTASLLLALSLVMAASLVLSRRGRGLLGLALVLGSLLLLTPVFPALVTGIGLSLALLQTVFTATLAGLSLPARRARPTILAGWISGVVALLIDLFWPSSRLALPSIFTQTVLPAAVIFGLVICGALVARQFARFALRTKLIIAFLAVVLVPLSLLAYLNDRAARASLTDTANRALFAAASQTAANLDNFVSNTVNAIHTEAQLPQFREFLGLPANLRPGTPVAREVGQLLQTLTNKDSRILSYLLLDAQGTVVASNATLDVGADKSAHDYFQVPFSSARPYVSAIDFSEMRESGSLLFSSPVRSANFQTVGVLVVRYNTHILQHLVAQSNDLAGPGSFGVLFDEHRLHLAHGTAPETLFKLVAPLEPDRVAQLQAAGRLPLLPAEQLSTDLPALDARLRNAAEQPFFMAQDVATGSRVNQVAVAAPTTRPWAVAFFQPEEIFLAPAEAQTRRTLLLAVLVSALAAAAAVGMSQLLAGPITRLTGAATRVAEGDLAARAAVESSDEIGSLAATFNSMTAQLQQTLTGLEQRVAERTAQLQAAADIGRATTSVRDLERLLQLAVQSIRERFGFYHASIFLMDPAGEFAVLRESTGEVGAQLKASGHRLAVGSQSLIGWVTRHRQPRVALDVAGDPFHFKNPLLPDTRSELAIPLMVGDRLLGALDVQSTSVNAFSESDVQVLQTLADQLSVAIQNAELFQRTQASLDELSALYQQVAGTGWRTLLHGQARELVYDLQPGAAPDGDGAAIEVPLRLRGEVVGAIELHGRAPGDLSAEERAVIETAAAQLAVALESAAVFEETQYRSRREQLINAITSEMRATLNPATILQSGIRALGKALGATEVVVQLHRTFPPSRPDDQG